jgi:hypothetical protein
MMSIQQKLSIYLRSADNEINEISVGSVQEEKPAAWDGTRVVIFLRGSFSALICNVDGHE